MTEKVPKTYLRHCPTCGLAMIGEKSVPGSEKYDRFSCMNCGTVVETSSEPGDDEGESDGS